VSKPDVIGATHAVDQQVSIGAFRYADCLVLAVSTDGMVAVHFIGFPQGSDVLHVVFMWRFFGSFSRGVVCVDNAKPISFHI
jgi:hypothetical protein